MERALTMYLKMTDKTEPEVTPESQVIAGIDELQRLSSSYRDEVLGATHFADVKKFYQLDEPVSKSPSFRPKVSVPELQMLFFQEASELSDTSPRVHIKYKDKREKDREKVFQQEWREGFFNNRILEATIWSLFSCNGYLQPGFDPLARMGQGQVWLRSRRPDTVFPDPRASSEDNWSFVIWEDDLYIEQIIDLYPERANDLLEASKKEGSTKRSIPTSADGWMSLPPGPLRSGPGQAPWERIQLGSGRKKLRTCFVYDFTVEDVEEIGGDPENKLIARPQYKLRYPNGRMIVDCDGIVLFDDNNPFPLRKFPLVRVPALPALFGFYPPPPSRFSKGLQDLSARMLTQVFENAVRLNNPVWFIPKDTGIDPDMFGGIPSEVQVIAANASRMPELRATTPFPQHYLQYPQYLLDKQKQLQGFFPARRGESGKGNVSGDMFDASVLQSQFLTKLRAKLLAESLQRVSEIVFYLMVERYLKDRAFADFRAEQESAEVTWKGTEGQVADDFAILLDPGSIQTMSEAALRQMVIGLRGAGMMDPRTGLELMNVPGADEIATNIEQEQARAALANVQRPRRG